MVKDDVVARGGGGFANENQLRSKTFLISQPNYNKNKRSGRCDCLRKSKHSKCSYTCEKRRGLTGISLQSSRAASKSGEYPHRKTERSG